MSRPRTVTPADNGIVRINANLPDDTYRKLILMQAPLQGGPRRLVSDVVVEAIEALANYKGVQ